MIEDKAKMTLFVLVCSSHKFSLQLCDKYEHRNFGLDATLGLGFCETTLTPLGRGQRPI